MIIQYEFLDLFYGSNIFKVYVTKVNVVKTFVCGFALDKKSKLIIITFTIFYITIELSITVVTKLPYFLLKHPV